MRNYVVVLGLMLLAVRLSAGADFLSQLSPADFTAAGLQKQTPAELVRLKALIEQYKSGELAAVRRAAEQEIKAAARKAPGSAENESNIMPPQTRKQPNWFTALLTLRHAGEKPEKEQPLTGRLVGDFDGWHGRTTFTLEDGTRWLQQNISDRYNYAPALAAPKVQIKPAAISGFWLEIEGVNLSVRVIPVDLAGAK